MIRTRFSIISLLCLIMTMSLVFPVRAANFFVGDATSLIAAINTANTNDEADVITLTADITLTTIIPYLTPTYILDEGNGLPSILLDFGNSLTIEGAGFTISRDVAAPAFRLFHIQSGATVIMNDITLTNGLQVGGGNNFGGAIMNYGSLTMNDSNILGNTAVVAGAILSWQDADATFTNILVEDNVATNAGGGLVNVDNALMTIIDSRILNNRVASGGGGGLYNEDAVMTISGSTISGNESVSFFGGGILSVDELTINDSTISGNRSGDRGGGLYLDGDTTITNSTISANTSADEGGGIYSDGNPISLINTTIAYNTATNSGDGIYFRFTSFTIQNSIISGNGTEDCAFQTPTIISNTYNIYGSGGNANGCTAGGTNIVPAGGIATIIDSLADNGGLTKTHELATGSSAIDAADNANCPVNDQRGFTRGNDGDGTPDSPEVGDCDIGAYELLPLPAYDSSPVVASTIDLGRVVLGESAVSILEISEVGDLILLVSLDSITGVNAADFSVVGLPTSLENGDVAQDIAIVCTPSSIGALTATITFTTNDPLQPTVSYYLICEGSEPVIVTDTVTITLPNGETVVVNAEIDYIEKTVDNPFATIGQTVIYTIRAHNPKDIPLTQVVIYDIFDERLDTIQLLSTTHGIGTFNGRTLTVNGFSLDPDEEATIVVSARVASLAIGETIPNAAILESPDASVHVSNLALIGSNTESNSGGAAQVFLIPSQLPNTGETPLLRHNVLLGTSIVMLIGAGFFLVRSRKTEAVSRKL